MSVQRLTPSNLEFDLVGVDASIANALRRVMIAEVSAKPLLFQPHADKQVPTMAIETVYVWNNTSIMQDEVLCHRIGLIPLKIDPRKMKSASDPRRPHENDTIIFDLRVRCDKRPEARADEPDPKKKYYDSDVYSGMLEWVPQGDQVNKFRQDPPRPVNDDILLVKLRAGQVS